MAKGLSAHGGDSPMVATILSTSSVVKLYFIHCFLERKL
jgi:hypothetical protein